MQLKLVSPNGDEGSGLIPGTKVYEPNCSIPANPARMHRLPRRSSRCVLTYTLDNTTGTGPALHDHTTSPEADTVLNLTNHSYFNMAGEAVAGSGLGSSSRSTPTGTPPPTPASIPTGQLAPVFGTPFNFRRF